MGCTNGFLLKNKKCQAICTCTNGTPATGSDCTTPAENCKACPANAAASSWHASASLLEVFAMGAEAAQIDLETSLGKSMLPPKVAAYFLKDKKCVLKVCKCANGVGAAGGDCPSDGAAKCAACNPGFHVVGGSKCEANKCKCLHGTPLDAKDARNDYALPLVTPLGKSSSALSASASSFLQALMGDSITSESALGGRAPKVMDPRQWRSMGCMTHGMQRCGQKCDVGYTLAGTGELRHCQLNHCVCPYGVVDLDEKKCPVDAGVSCKSCNKGFHLKPKGPSQECVMNVCKCPRDAGIGAVGPGCYKDGADFCSQCRPGWQGPHGMGICSAICVCPNGQPKMDTYPQGGWEKNCKKSGDVACLKADDGFALKGTSPPQP